MSISTSMYKIVSKSQLAANIFQMDIEAPRVAASALPGQFVIIRLDKTGERIPLTICDYDTEKGTVSIVVQVVGRSTIKMSEYQVGDYLQDFVGPLGQPSEFVHEDPARLAEKRIVFVAGGLGTAPVYPQVKWLHDHGVKADVIIGAKTRDLLIMVDEMRAVSGNLFIATDDGSEGFNGLVTGCLEELVVKRNFAYNQVIAIGPMIMMKFVCQLTQKLNIPTVVSLNTLMVDGTGMCGACRVTVGGKTRFACVDGPEFDGHQVDFAEAMRRQAMYKGEEGQQLFKDQVKRGEEKDGGCHV